MTTQKKMVFIGAHPDDETFGIGSTLAQYALSGTKVYVVCATGGEAGTVDPEYMQGYNSIAELRANELKCAAEVLKLAGVTYLGFRDSGMRGSPDNANPAALINVPLAEVSRRIIRILRDIKPDVVITHDAGGGYGHPDHIAVHNATIRAFYAAGDATQYPEAGPAFQPRKLYFGVRTRRLMRFMVRLMPLFGQDPRHAGRNRDIDMTRMTGEEYPVHAVIKLSKLAVEIRRRAAACHASQGGGRGFRRRGPFWVLQILGRLQGPRDFFMRDYPQPPPRHREKDLFAGL